MKKLLAVFLAVLMMLSACAVAEGYGLTLKNIVAYAGEAVLLDLSGIDLGLEYYADENAFGAKISLGALDQEVLNVVIAEAGEEFLLSMSGVSGVYSIDQSAIAGAAAEAMPLPEAEAETVSPEDQAAFLALLDKAIALVENGVIDAEDTEIDGVAYAVSAIEITEDAVAPLLEELVVLLDNYSYALEGSGVESFSELYTQLQPAVSVSGALYDSETIGVADVTLQGSIGGGAQSGLLNLYLEGAQDATGDAVSFYIEATVASGAQSYTLAFNLEGASGDGSWMPAADVETINLLTAVEDEAQMQKLGTEALSSAMMALSYMAAANETVAALLNNMMMG